MRAAVVLRIAVFPLMKKQTVKAGGRFRDYELDQSNLVSRLLPVLIIRRNPWTIK